MGVKITDSFNGGLINSGLAITTTGTDSAIIVNANNTASTTPAVVINNLGGSDCLQISDDTAPDVSLFRVSNNGNVLVGFPSTQGTTEKFYVNGSIRSVSEIRGQTFTVSSSTTYTTPTTSINGMGTQANGAASWSSSVYNNEIIMVVGANKYAIPARII